MKRVYRLFFAATATLSAPVIAHAALAPLPKLYQDVNTRGTASLLSMHQDYKETGTSSTKVGKTISGTLDKETGDLTGFRLGWRHQNAHFGNIFTVNFLSGNTHYDGHSLYDGSPLTGTTKNNLVDLNLVLNYGFSLASAPRLAIVPGVDLGYSIWRRQLADGSDETYYHGSVMGRLGLAYALTDKFLLDGGVAAGRTVVPWMHANTGTNYTLGTAGTSKAWLEGTYVFNRYIDIFAMYEQTSFEYKASSVQSDGTIEPDSKTTHGYLSAGVGYRF